MILALLLAAAACPGTQIEVHGTAAKAGSLDVYAAPGEVEATTALVAGRPWSVCVDPTEHPIKADGPYRPWFDEVNYAYADGTSRHERWRVPWSPKSVEVKKIVTDGNLH